MPGSRAETAKLIASLELEDKTQKGATGINRALNGIDRHLATTESRALKAGNQIGTGIKNGAAIAAVGVGLLATQVVIGLRQLATLDTLAGQTNAALTSTKGVAGQTADSVRALAERMENLNATIDDKVIQSAENMLLTFTNVRKEAFEPALLAALDLNTAMGGGPDGLQGNIIKVGKALNDPTKGLTALSRVGVKFTDQQTKQIKALQKSGDLLGAQRIILAELGTEFGGRFAAQGAKADGTIAGIGDAVEDLQKALATGLFPVIQKNLPKLREFLTSPAFQKGAEDLGKAIAGIFTDQNIAEGTAALEGIFKTAKEVAPAIASAAKVTGEVVKTAVDLFRSLPPEIQALAVAGLAINKLTGGLVTNLAGGLISAVISSFRGLMNVNAAVVNVNGAVKGVPGVPGGGVPGAVGAGAGVLGLGTTLISVAGAAVIGGLIAEAIAVPVTKAIDPGLSDPNNTQLGQRDPRRFNADGQVVRNFIAKPTVDAIKAATREDSRAALHVEQAVVRNAQSVIASARASTQRFIQTVKDKDQTVDLTINNKTGVTINGRLLDAATSRYQTVFSSAGNLGGRGPR